MRSAVTVGLLVILLVYLIAGGLVFWSLESGRQSDEQPRHHHQLLLLLSEMRGKLDRLSALVQAESAADAGNQVHPASNLSSLVDNELLQLISSLQEDIDRLSAKHLHPNATAITITTTTNCSSSNSSVVSDPWDVPGSIFFALTVVTTIGYGHLTPSSAGGQVFCCIYAVVGIPLCLIVLISIGDKLRHLSSRFDVCLSTNWPRCTAGPHLRSAIILSVGAIVFLFIPSAIFSSLEGWSYGSAFYFTIISLATIGFGDYVAGVNYVGAGGVLYRLMVAVWIFLGLSWLSGVIASFQNSLQLKIQDIDDKPIITRIRTRANEATEEQESLRMESEPNRHEFTRE